MLLAVTPTPKLPKALGKTPLLEALFELRSVPRLRVRAMCSPACSRIAVNAPVICAAVFTCLRRSTYFDSVINGENKMFTARC